jgi:parallel beta-helix repeat protein
MYLEEEVMKKFNSKTAIQCLAFVCALMLLSQISLAGSLEPNAPPGSTMKPLDQVEPRTPIPASAVGASTYIISKSGSYYLVGDRQCNSAIGIRVDVNNVTIDLAGFSLIGNNGSGYGVYMSGRSNVEIRNGTVRNFSIGIGEESINGFGDRVIGVRAISNAGSGIHLVGKGNEVRGCTASNNGTSASSGNVYGIFAGIGSTITGNTISNNGTFATTGVYVLMAGYGCTITGNTVSNNFTSANYGWLFGISAGAGSTIAGNTVYNNGTSATGSSIFDAVYASMGSTVIGNTVYNNGISGTGTFYGIYLEGNNLVDQNAAYNNNGTNMNHPVNCVYGTNLAP